MSCRCMYANRATLLSNLMLVNSKPMKLGYLRGLDSVWRLCGMTVDAAAVPH